MKSKTIWIIIGIVILLAVLYWGSQTNWWGLKKSTNNSTQNIANRSLGCPSGTTPCATGCCKIA